MTGHGLQGVAVPTNANPPERVILADREKLSQEAARRFIALAQARDPFTVALSGGSTPRRLYQILATTSGRVPWERVHVFWGDERCVPPDHPESNYRMAREALLDHVPLPAKNVHRVRGEWAPEAAAQAYAVELEDFFGAPWPRFDLILLGLGSDGHTASLFPGSDTLHERERPIAVATATYQDRPAQRVTFTLPLINAARHVLFLVSGADKADIVQRVLETAGEHYPAGRVQPGAGRLTWLLDQAAAGQIDLPAQN
jgi:6-phosphogluconolactonase